MEIPIFHWSSDERLGAFVQEYTIFQIFNIKNCFLDSLNAGEVEVYKNLNCYYIFFKRNEQCNNTIDRGSWLVDWKVVYTRKLSKCQVFHDIMTWIVCLLGFLSHCWVALYIDGWIIAHLRKFFSCKNIYPKLKLQV